MDDAFLASMLGDFLDESTDLIHTLNENLLAIDGLFQSLEEDAVATIETRRMNEMFRAVHNLKGLSAMLGLDDIHVLTHKMENVFDAARNAELPVRHEVVGVVCSAVDRLTAMIDALKEDSGETVEFDTVVEDLDKLLAGDQTSLGINSTAEGSPCATGKSKPAESLRVDIQRLDQLLVFAEQLASNTAELGQLKELLNGITTAGEADRCAEAHGVIDELSRAILQLQRISSGIQTCVVDIRMAPIGPLFERFTRVIRDVTRGNGKDIRLHITGENMELDKRMFDELGDPLIHMARNSADHGIETPAERVAAGKPPHGEVRLAAFQRGDQFVIQVRDDGRGLDPQQILAKAMAKGIVTRSNAQRLSPHETYQLIWTPGFSTAEKITEISGRGVGMDIVKSKIEGIGGSVELDSTPGVGTTITIKLPLSVAILPASSFN